jgi:hypothetical protein
MCGIVGGNDDRYARIIRRHRSSRSRMLSIAVGMRSSSLPTSNQ